MTLASTTKSWNVLLPLIVTSFDPGPSIVKLDATMSGPLVKVMVPNALLAKSMISPEGALLMALRSEPGPLSFVFVTVSTPLKSALASSMSIKGWNLVPAPRRPWRFPRAGLVCRHSSCRFARVDDRNPKKFMVSIRIGED